jgi:Mg-chelatase subunit ChlD
MGISPGRGKIAAALTVGLAAVSAVGITSTAGGQGRGSCSPLDLSFVVDNSGSMGGAISNVKRGLDNIITEAERVGAGNVRYAVVTFPENNVVVNQPFTGSESTARSAVNGISLGGGGGIPESSDEAMNTVVNGLSASDRAPGQQTGNFQPPYRRSAEKIAILITDALPGGFRDEYTSEAKSSVRTVADQARRRGIRVTAIYVGGRPTPDPELRGIMRAWARRTGGEYRTTTSDGRGVSAAIRASIARCGGKPTRRRMRVRPNPRNVRVGSTRCITFTVRSGRSRVRRARVRFVGQTKRTNSSGRATFCVRFSRTGCRGVRATRSGYRTARSRVCVAAAPRFTG